MASSIDTLQQNTVHEATPSEVDAVRRPTQIYTQGYLESPIEYKVDPRFIPPTVARQLSDLPDKIKRDYASALQINLNADGSQGIMVNMISPIWLRSKYINVMGSRSQFRYF